MQSRLLIPIRKPGRTVGRSLDGTWLACAANKFGVLHYYGKQQQQKQLIVLWGVGEKEKEYDAATEY